METFKQASKDFKRLLWVMGFFSLFTNLLMLAVPLYMLQIYDRVLPSQSSNTLTFLSILAVFALLILGCMETVRTILANRMANRVDVKLGETLLRQVINKGSITGGNAQPMRDLSGVKNLISSRQAFALLDLPFSSIFIAVLYLIHPDLFWITLAGALVLAVIALFNQFAGRNSAKKQGEKQMFASMQSEFLARNADSLVAMGMVKNVVDHWGTHHADSAVAGDRSAKTNAFFSGLSRFIRLGLQIAILGYGALLVLEGEMTPGMIFASSIISGRALQPIDQVIGAWRNLSAGIQSWKRLGKFLDVAKEQEEFTELPEPKGLLQVKDVIQRNAIDPSAAPVLAKVSFVLEPGTSVAVLGPSGSGKSTLARIIVRAIAPSSGTVRIDGNDINNWNPEQLGKYIGYLAQDVELLPGTIAQNISRFSPNPDSNAIVKAAEMAHADDLIKSMPKGYDTPIGPGGAQISGGEKQRIGLARAFYGDPKLLVLDEPNSSLDKFGEAALIKAMREAKKQDISVFIISQRESALTAVDKIMRIQNGAILDYGPRNEIIQKYRGGKPNNAQTKKKIQKTENPEKPAEKEKSIKNAGPITYSSAFKSKTSNVEGEK